MKNNSTNILTFTKIITDPFFLTNIIEVTTNSAYTKLNRRRVCIINSCKFNKPIKANECVITNPNNNQSDNLITMIRNKHSKYERIGLFTTNCYFSYIIAYLNELAV